MNTDLRHLRIAVVPTETGNGISPESTVEEILACEETQLFTVPDYCQVQNDDDIDLLHWAFLINIETKTNLTGVNTDGVDYHSRAQKIGYIQSVIKEFGVTDCDKLQEDQPCMNSVGNTLELVHEFCESGVRTHIVDNGTTKSENFYEYEKLEDNILTEVYEIVNFYEHISREK